MMNFSENHGDGFRNFKTNIARGDPHPMAAESDTEGVRLPGAAEELRDLLAADGVRLLLGGDERLS